MSNLNKLFELTDALNDSACNEGCEADLMVVGSAQLWDLLQYVRLLKRVNEGQGPSNLADIENICGRLLDSEEHAGDAAIPQVAEDAVEVIKRLSVALEATQVALSQAMQHAKQASEFVNDIANGIIWDFNTDDEIDLEDEAPRDGYLDSHTSLMDAIKSAREIQKSQP